MKLCWKLNSVSEDVSLTFADHAKDIADSMRNAAIVDMVSIPPFEFQPAIVVIV